VGAVHGYNPPDDGAGFKQSPENLVEYLPVGFLAESMPEMVKRPWLGVLLLNLQAFAACRSCLSLNASLRSLGFGVSASSAGPSASTTGRTASFPVPSYGTVL
jgi:hypothetical protein